MCAVAQTKYEKMTIQIVTIMNEPKYLFKRLIKQNKSAVHRNYYYNYL